MQVLVAFVGLLVVPSSTWQQQATSYQNFRTGHGQGHPLYRADGSWSQSFGGGHRSFGGNFRGLGKEGFSVIRLNNPFIGGGGHQGFSPPAPIQQSSYPPPRIGLSPAPFYSDDAPTAGPYQPPQPAYDSPPPSDGGFVQGPAPTYSSGPLSSYEGQPQPNGPPPQTYGNDRLPAYASDGPVQGYNNNGPVGNPPPQENRDGSPQESYQQATGKDTLGLQDNPSIVPSISYQSHDSTSYRDDGNYNNYDTPKNDGLHPNGPSPGPIQSPQYGGPNGQGDYGPNSKGFGHNPGPRGPANYNPNGDYRPPLDIGKPQINSNPNYDSNGRPLNSGYGPNAPNSNFAKNKNLNSEFRPSSADPLSDFGPNGKIVKSDFVPSSRDPSSDFRQGPRGTGSDYNPNGSGPNSDFRQNNNKGPDSGFTVGGKGSKSDFSINSKPSSDFGHNSKDSSSEFGLGSDGPGSDFGIDSKDPSSDFGLDSKGPSSDFGLDSKEPSSDFGLDSKGPSSDFGLDSKEPGSDFGLDSKDPISDFGLDSKDTSSDFGLDSKDSGTDFGLNSKGPSSDFGLNSKGPNSNFGLNSKGPSSNFGPNSKGPSSGFGLNGKGPNSDFGLNGKRPNSDFGLNSKGPNSDFGLNSKGSNSNFKGSNSDFGPNSKDLNSDFGFSNKGPNSDFNINRKGQGSDFGFNGKGSDFDSNGRAPSHSDEPGYNNYENRKSFNTVPGPSNKPYASPNERSGPPQHTALKKSSNGKSVGPQGPAFGAEARTPLSSKGEIDRSKQAGENRGKPNFSAEEGGHSYESDFPSTELGGQSFESELTDFPSDESYFNSKELYGSFERKGKEKFNSDEGKGSYEIGSRPNFNSGEKGFSDRDSRYDSVERSQSGESDQSSESRNGPKFRADGPEREAEDKSLDLSDKSNADKKSFRKGNGPKDFDGPESRILRTDKKPLGLVENDSSDTSNPSVSKPFIPSKSFPPFQEKRASLAVEKFVPFDKPYHRLPLTKRMPYGVESRIPYEVRIPYSKPGLIPRLYKRQPPVEKTVFSLKDSFNKKLSLKGNRYKNID